LKNQFDYVPKSFRQVPERLEVANPPATADELRRATEIRARFTFADKNVPYMNDIIRAFRLVKGAQTYLEIGIYDRGNLSYAATLLSDHAHLIGLDIEPNPEHDARLRRSMRVGQSYTPIIGDSRSDDTFEKVRDTLNGEKVDALFIDGGHDAQCVMSDYAMYSDLVKEDGVILFHDALWDGNAQYKGVRQALECIDKLDPLFTVIGEEPVHRYIPAMFVAEVWGCVGVLLPSMMAHRVSEHQR
jgi:predicted O-methyltransferase YrrM